MENSEEKEKLYADYEANRSKKAMTEFRRKAFEVRPASGCINKNKGEKK